MKRIESAASNLRDKKLLEIGCHTGYNSLEFIKRGVNATAVDLTPAVVDFTRRHFETVGVSADEVKVGNAPDFTFPDNTFDAVWSNGVLHATGDTAQAIAEARRVLKPGGRAIISQIYCKPSWMYVMHHVGRENIEYKEENPPVNEFYFEREIESMFDGFEIVATYRDHYRALPIARTGLKAALYRYGFKLVYNLLPENLAEKKLAYKYSVTAVRVNDWLSVVRQHK